MKYRIINLDNQQRVTCPNKASVKRVLRNVESKGGSLNHLRVEFPDGSIRHALEVQG